MKNTLHVKDLFASTKEGKQILKGVTLTVKKGEIHALMGPNGGGKSTLAQVLMGHPGYVIDSGLITVNGVDITKMTPDQKAKQGLFLGFQYPVEIAGVNFAHFLRMAMNEKSEKKVSPIKFRNLVRDEAQELSFSHEIEKRNLNEGFSGGEKKKAEILQMAILKPDFAILDEPDSGLDVDALRYIAKKINALDYPFGLLLITHYQRILHYIKPDVVHILIGGKIVKSGDMSLAKEIEDSGYEKYLQ